MIAVLALAPGFLRPSLFGRSLLVLVLASPALARDVPEKLTIRTLSVPTDPVADPLPIFVSGQVVTTLRFEVEVEVDPAKTKLPGWEGRFEPLLVGGKKVVVEPLHNLGSGEALPLLVRLTDGTQFTFLVKAATGAGWVDVQLNVFKSQASYDAMVSDLIETKARARDLREETLQLREEVSSVDSALAMLLANGEEAKTSFRPVTELRPKNKDMGTVVKLFSGVGKAAAVVQLTNTRHGGYWRFDRAYLTRDLDSQTAGPFAVRTDRPVIVPGDSGKIAVVVDRSAFEVDGGKLADLALQIFGDDGVQQVKVVMDHTLVRK